MPPPPGRVILRPSPGDVLRRYCSRVTSRLGFSLPQYHKRSLAECLFRIVYLINNTCRHRRVQGSRSERKLATRARRRRRNEDSPVESNVERNVDDMPAPCRSTRLKTRTDWPPGPSQPSWRRGTRGRPPVQTTSRLLANRNARPTA